MQQRAFQSRGDVFDRKTGVRRIFTSTRCRDGAIWPSVQASKLIVTSASPGSDVRRNSDEVGEIDSAPAHLQLVRFAHRKRSLAGGGKHDFHTGVDVLRQQPSYATQAVVPGPNPGVPIARVISFWRPIFSS